MTVPAGCGATSFYTLRSHTSLLIIKSCHIAQRICKHVSKRLKKKKGKFTKCKYFFLDMNMVLLKL